MRARVRERHWEGESYELDGRRFVVGAEEILREEEEDNTFFVDFVLFCLFFLIIIFNQILVYLYSKVAC